jgi:hypothetical protein
VSYFSALAIRRNGEYYCKRCKKESNIHIKKTILILFFFMLALSVLALLYFLFLTDRENLWFMLIVAIPFFIFYLFTPIFVTLKPKKKFMDALYDTQMVEAEADPDPTMAQTAKVVPAFVDDIVLGDEEYKPAIDSAVFTAIKEERKVVAETDGGTKSFDRFENISSSGTSGDTMPVENLRSVTVKKDNAEKAVIETVREIAEEPDTDSTPGDSSTDRGYDLSIFE